MSGSIIRIDQLSDAIKKEVEAMNLEVIKQCNEAADEVGKEAVRELKATSPVRADGYQRKYPPGSYAKSWTVKKEADSTGVNGVTVHNKEHYQLTHLLEFGHVIASTGERSNAFPHIAAVNESASQKFVEKVEEMKL